MSVYRNIKVIIPIKYVGAVDPGALKTGALKTGSRAQHAAFTSVPTESDLSAQVPTWQIVLYLSS